MVLETESRAIGSLRLDDRFATAVEWILGCKGQVVLTGIGKPGFVAQKISATLASTGTHSLYLHPAEAAHGDLGRVSGADVVIALSNSGESEEILRLLPALKRIGARIVAISRDDQNPLARAADLVVAIGDVEEACPWVSRPPRAPPPFSPWEMRSPWRCWRTAPSAATSTPSTTRAGSWGVTS